MNNKQRQVLMFLILLFKLSCQFPLCLFSLSLSSLCSLPPPSFLSLLKDFKFHSVYLALSAIKRGSSALPSPSFRSNTEGGLKSFYYAALKLQSYLLIFFCAWTYIDCSTKMFYNLSAVYSGKKNSPNCPLYGFLKV